jgi:hypothetical protein
MILANGEVYLPIRTVVFGIGTHACLSIWHETSHVPRPKNGVSAPYLFFGEIAGTGALSRFFDGAMLLTDPVLEVIRHELRRVSPDVRINIEQIGSVLSSEVIKRDVLEGEKADEARKKIAKAAAKALRIASLRAEKKEGGGAKAEGVAIQQD